jgi:NTE family protein
LLLSRNTLAYSNISDFDELPTPFRCVATDLISGDAVVLRQGSLAQAMRATMSIPAVFTPVKQNEMVLVDGGLVENISVQVVRKMGATMVIAVALETPKPKPEQLRSLADVLRQSVTVAVAQNERRSLASADLVISVDTTKFSSTDYSSRPYEAGRFDQGSQRWQTHQSTSTGIFFPTAVGAAGFSVSLDEFGKARFRLILGWF